jgi:predicted metal-dependent hydrolase
MQPKIAEGVRLFNSQKFFEAHEALEEVWLKTTGREKIFLHGLIQVAAAFHHHSRRNSAGFRSLLEKGLAKLEEFGETIEGIDLDGLRKQLQPWRERMNAAVAPGASHLRNPPLPRIETN